MNFIASHLALFQFLAALVVFALTVPLVAAIRARIKSRIASELLAYLSTLAATLVWGAADRVRALKRADAFTADVARELAAGVVVDLASIGGEAVHRLAKLQGLNQTAVEKLLHQLVEDRVEALRRTDAGPSGFKDAAHFITQNFSLIEQVMAMCFPPRRVPHAPASDAGVDPFGETDLSSIIPPAVPTPIAPAAPVASNLDTDEVTLLRAAPMPTPCAADGNCLRGPQVVHAPRVPRVPLAPSQAGRASVLALLACLALPVPAYFACVPNDVRPQDAAVVHASSWTDSARRVLSALSWAVPSARAVLAQILPWAEAEIVGRVCDGVADAAHGLEVALDAYDARGGDACVAKSAAAGVRVALLEMADTLAREGIALGVPLGRVIDAASSIIDNLVPACPTDGGAWQSSGDTANDHLHAIDESARARGIVLRRDLDAIRPLAMDGGVR